MKRIRGIHYKTLAPVDIIYENGVITGIVPLSIREHMDVQLDDETGRNKVGLPFIGPGLVDLQINGYNGVDFNSAQLTVDDVISVSSLLQKEGVQAYCPTIITNDSDFIENTIRTIVLAAKQDHNTKKSIAGIHIEGPFISPEDGPRGAHPKEFVTKPNIDFIKRMQAAAEGLLKIITLAPEWENANEIIAYCCSQGIRAAIGHTAANSSQIHSAVLAGADLSTHLGNGAHGMLKRHPNYIWSQLAEEQLYSSIIADGFHLPKEVLKVIMKVKGDKTMLVSDATIFAGMKPGDYHSIIGGDVVLSPENRLYMKDNPELLAGSASSLPNCVSFLIESGLCSISKAWKMASDIPAIYMNTDNYMLKPGSSTDLVLFYVENNKVKIKEALRF